MGRTDGRRNEELALKDRRLLRDGNVRSLKGWPWIAEMTAAGPARGGGGRLGRREQHQAGEQPDPQRARGGELHGHSGGLFFAAGCRDRRTGTMMKAPANIAIDAYGPERVDAVSPPSPSRCAVADYSIERLDQPVRRLMSPRPPD